ncbi:MAG: caspase family protein [Blautia sp.]|nr:caspase family protein [Blautia sp.]
MKERGKRLLLLFSVLIVMILAAVSANAEEAAFIQTGSRPTVIKDSAGSVAKAVSRPQITSLYNSNNGVGIKLKKQSGVLYYDFYRYEAGKGTKYIGWCYGSQTNIIDTTSKSGWGKSYVYSVYATDNNYRSSRVSNKPRIVRIPPAKVTSAQAASASSIKIRWKPAYSCSKVSGYQIEYAKSKNDLSKKKGTFKKATLSKASARSATLSGLSANTTYYYRIRAFYRYKVNGKLKINYSAYTTFATVKTKAMGTKYRALLVGNSNYKDPRVSDLKGPKNDVNAMAKTLRNYHYTTTIKQDMSKSQMLNAIRYTFSGASSSDVSLFFYSGHGGYNRYTSKAYLAGADSSLLYMNDLASALKKIPGKVIVVLDSCYGGNAIYKSAEGEFTPEVFNQFVVDEFAMADSDSTVIKDDDSTEKNGELRNSKFLVLTGGSKGEYTYESRINGAYGGVFTRYFVGGAGCSFPGGSYTGKIPADKNSDKKVTLTEMWSYTRNAVIRREYQHVSCYPSGSSSVILKK